MNLQKPKFDIGQKVYLIVDADVVGMVTGIMYRQNNISYIVSWNDHEETYHYDFELATERPVI